jgi:hypothetical protein
MVRGRPPLGGPVSISCPWPLCVTTVTDRRTDMRALSKSTSAQRKPIASPRLSGVDPAGLPNAEASVDRLLKTKPATVDGHARTKVTRSEVRYADGTIFTAQSLVEAAPGMAMNDFFARFKSSGQFSVGDQNSPGAALLWFSGEGQPPYNRHVAAVAKKGGKWVFGIDAVDTVAFDSLVRALAAATT